MPEEVKRQPFEDEETQEEPNDKLRNTSLLEKMQSELLMLQGEKRALEMEIADIQIPENLDSMSLVQRKTITAEIVKRTNKLAEINSRIDDMERRIELVNVTVSRNKHFDKYLIFQNIRELLKTSEIKLGQIEKEAGCQPGYMSRLEKAENATDPTMEFIVTAAKLLNVSLDVLTNAVIQDITPTESYLASFLEKMIRDTVSDRLEWNRETHLQLQDLPIDDDGNVGHVLFYRQTLVLNSTDGGKYEDERPVFYSRAYEEATEISGDCFNIRLKNDARLYLMSVEPLSGISDDNPQHIEAWMWQRRQGASFLCGTQSRELIRKLVSDLYNAVAESIKHPKLRKNVQAVIDAFMKDDLEDDVPKTRDGDLPF